MESLISAPCLLDDLMDTGIINVDINFGGPKDDELKNFKKSPSHESDSGVSIMSSPQHSIISEFEDDASFPLSPPSFENFENLLDTELTSYLVGETDSNDGTDIDVASIISVSPVMPTNTTSNTDHCYQHQISNESLQNSDDENNTAVNSIVNTCETPKNFSNVSALPPVKVIKVITAPKSSSRSQMEKEIYEAIDEKNKKNAKQAKINREKKKAYIKSLEDDVDSLKSENLSLKEKVDKLDHHKNSLEEEVEYLKSVLANQSTLSNLLKNIPNANVKLSSSFINRKRGAAHDHDYQGPSKHTRKSKTAGVCLHVEDENVSLEFCPSCSRNAQQSWS